MFRSIAPQITRLSQAVVIALVTLSSTMTSAEFITTESAMNESIRSGHVQQVTAFLGTKHVQGLLIARGVNPDDAALRVAAMTDAELAVVANHIDTLPAGGVGVIEVVGVVAVVLIVLELLGVTDVFTAI